MTNSNLDELKNELIKYGKLVWERGYSPGYSGNISARLNGTETFIITTSGSANGFLTKDELVVTDFKGCSLELPKKPSSEKLLHIEFYKLRKDINFIIHVHSPYLSSFASSNKKLNQVIMAENIYYLDEIPLAEYGLPSSIDLVEKTAKYFKNYDAVMMSNHGVIVGGKTLNEAYCKLELAETYAQVVFNTEILGGAKELTPAQVNDIKKLRQS